MRRSACTVAGMSSGIWLNITLWSRLYALHSRSVNDLLRIVSTWVLLKLMLRIFEVELSCHSSKPCLFIVLLIYKRNYFNASFLLWTKITLCWRLQFVLVRCTQNCQLSIMSMGNRFTIGGNRLQVIIKYYKFYVYMLATNLKFKYYFLIEKKVFNCL